MQVFRFVSFFLLAGLAGCATLPTSGPTGGQIEKSARSNASRIPIRLVEVQAANDLPVSPVGALPQMKLPDLPPPPTDMVGPGDVLDVHIYEAGVSLFAASTSIASAAGDVSAGVQVQTLPPSRVDDDGDIEVPYGGKLHVAGHTVSEVEKMIRTALRGMSQNPQVDVNITQAITNSVIVNGEVQKPGRLVLQTNREKLSDVIALAGGYRGQAKDLAVRVERNGRVAEMRLDRILEDTQANILAYPGDRLTILSKPWLFSVLGASGRVQQIPFSRTGMSLIEGIAQAGGAHASYGDPAAVFVFRYDENGKPVVFHFNMMHTGAYFLAQKFALHNDDVLYFGSARANRPGRLIQLISQLFSPIVVITNAANTLK